MQAGPLFIGIVWSVGLVTGLLLGRFPGLQAVPMPVLTLPLGAGLLFDLVVQTGLARGLRPVTMTERFAGVIGGAAVAFGVSAALR